MCRYKMVQRQNKLWIYEVLKLITTDLASGAWIIETNVFILVQLFRGLAYFDRVQKIAIWKRIKAVIFYYHKKLRVSCYTTLRYTQGCNEKWSRFNTYFSFFYLTKRAYLLNVHQLARMEAQPNNFISWLFNNPC